MQKYVGMTMPKSIQTRWYIGMAVCKGRGDDIKHKVYSRTPPITGTSLQNNEAFTLPTRPFPSSHLNFLIYPNFLWSGI